jgi:hypothetical protein
MKNKLPALTVAVLLVGGGVLAFQGYQRSRAGTGEKPAMPVAATPVASQVPAQPTAGDQLLLQARTQLERRTSVTARLRHQISLNGRQLAGFGGYWQQGRGDDLHMRLELKFFNEDTALLQISNGRFLWADQRLPAGRSISRLDLRKVRSEWSTTDDDFDELESGQAMSALPASEPLIRYGGLPTLLASLSDCFAFLPPQPMRWTPAPPLEGLPSSLPVFAVVGRWKPEKLVNYLPDNEGEPSAAQGVPPPERLPREVLVLIGQADLFPYRIEFRKQLSHLEPSPGSGQIPPFQLSREPLLLLELSAVTFDSQIAVSQFDFSPGEAEWDDRTAECLDAMRLRSQTRTAARDQESR